MSTEAVLPERRSSRFRVSYSRGDARLLFVLLLILDACLAAAYILIHILTPPWSWGPLRALFDLDRESSIPTWFSTVQLFGAAIALVALAERLVVHRPFVLIGAAVLMFLSIDESAAIHEKVTAVANAESLHALQALMIQGKGAWIAPYLIIGIIIAALSIRPIRYMFARHPSSSLIITSGVASFLAGAVGLEIFSYLVTSNGPEAAYRAGVAAEEFLELVGVSAVFYGILRCGSEREGHRHAQISLDGMSPFDGSAERVRCIVSRSYRGSIYTTARFL